jgi:hypothetical protein
LYRCRFRSTSFYPPATSPSALSRVKILRHFSSGGDSSVLGEEVSFGVGRGRCRIGLSRSCASPTKVVTSSVLASAFFTGAILSLCLGERAVFDDGDSSSFAERERFGWSPFAFGRDHLPRPGGPAVASSVTVVVVSVSGSLSSMRSRMAASDFSFLCQCRSCSGRCSFIVLGASLMVHGVRSCGVSNAWRCALDLAGGFGSGFTV